MSHWPSGCHSPNSCDRNGRCMYIKCEYERKDIKEMIRYQRHIRDINRMNDKGEIPPLPNGERDSG